MRPALPARVARRPRSQQLVAFSVLAVGSVALLLYEGRGSTFQIDEWVWLLYRRGHSLWTFLTPHNGNLSLVPVAVYKLFFRVFGATSTLPFRLLDAMLGAACALLLFVFVSRRLGGWIALAAASVLLFFGPGWDDLLWGFQIGYLGSLAAGFGALLALDRADRGGDVLAALALTVSVACSSVGLMILLGAAVEIALTAWTAGRRALAARTTGWRRVWVVAVPLALYGLWYSQYGFSTASLSRADAIPRFVFEGISASAASITGLAAPAGPPPYGPLFISSGAGSTIAVLLLAAVALQVTSGRILSPRFWGIVAAILAFWSAVALSYAFFRAPNATRYAYPVSMFLMVAGAEFCSHLRPGRRSTLLLATVATAVVASNLGFLRQGARLLAHASEYARAELAAMEVARGAVASTFTPQDPSITLSIGFNNMIGVDAGRYFTAVDAFGSPAENVSTLLRHPESAREAADLVLARAERLSLAPSTEPRARCITRNPTTAGFIDLSSRAGTIVLKATGSPITSVMVRRFANRYRYASLGAVPKGSTVALRLPPDRSSLPWQARLASSAPVNVCGGAPR